jgi:hypothetical protein
MAVRWNECGFDEKSRLRQVKWARHSLGCSTPQDPGYLVEHGRCTENIDKGMHPRAGHRNNLCPGPVTSLSVAGRRVQLTGSLEQSSAQSLRRDS